MLSWYKGNFGLLHILEHCSTGKVPIVFIDPMKPWIPQVRISNNNMHEHRFYISGCSDGVLVKQKNNSKQIAQEISICEQCIVEGFSFSS